MVVHCSRAQCIIPITPSEATVTAVTIIVIVVACVSIVTMEVVVASIDSIIAGWIVGNERMFALETAPIKAAFLMLGTFII